MRFTCITSVDVVVKVGAVTKLDVGKTGAICVEDKLFRADFGEFVGSNF